MNYNTLKELTIKHVNLTIETLHGSKTPRNNSVTFSQVLEEQVFITLSFIGALLDRSNKKIYKHKVILGYKYLWNYSKHGKSVFTYVTLNVKPTCSFPLHITESFHFGEGYYAWKSMPFDNVERNENQYAAYCELLEGKNVVTTLKEFLDLIDLFVEKRPLNE
jgi:hypothetical protein